VGVYVDVLLSWRSFAVVVAVALLLLSLCF
jgi:hypothetical protein